MVKLTGMGQWVFCGIIALLASSPEPFNQQTLNLQQRRVQNSPPGADDYYSAILTLFGQGGYSIVIILPIRESYSPHGTVNVKISG